MAFSPSNQSKKFGTVGFSKEFRLLRHDQLRKTTSSTRWSSFSLHGALIGMEEDLGWLLTKSLTQILELAVSSCSSARLHKVISPREQVVVIVVTFKCGAQRSRRICRQVIVAIAQCLLDTEFGLAAVAPFQFECLRRASKERSRAHSNSLDLIFLRLSRKGASGLRRKLL